MEDDDQPPAEPDGALSPTNAPPVPERRPSKARKGKTTKPESPADKPTYLDIETADAILDISELRAQAPLQWAIPGLLPAPGVSLLAGPPSSGKSYCLLSMAGTIAYGLNWGDQKVEHKLAFIVTNENIRNGTVWPSREAAWLRDNRLPQGPRVQNAIKIVNPYNEMFRRTKAGYFSLLDPETIDALCAEIIRFSERVGMPVGVISFDTIGSLTPHNLSDAEARKLMRNAHAMAIRFQAHVLFVVHTHRNAPEKYLGPASLKGNCDASFVLVRDDSALNPVTGAPYPMRSILQIDRMKAGFDRFAVEFVGREVELDIRDDGKPITDIAMRMNSIIAPRARVDAYDSELRLSIIKALPDGAYSASDVLQAIGRGKGGKQSQLLHRLVSYDSILVQLPDGTAKRLQRITPGRREMIEISTVLPEAPPEPDPDPNPDGSESGSVVPFRPLG